MLLPSRPWHDTQARVVAPHIHRPRRRRWWARRRVSVLPGAVALVGGLLTTAEAMRWKACGGPWTIRLDRTGQRLPHWPLTATLWWLLPPLPLMLQCSLAWRATPASPGHTDGQRQVSVGHLRCEAATPLREGQGRRCLQLRTRLQVRLPGQPRPLWGRHLTRHLVFRKLALCPWPTGVLAVPVVAFLAVGWAVLSPRDQQDPLPPRTWTWRRQLLPARRGGSGHHGRQRRPALPAARVPATLRRAALLGGLTAVGGVGWPRSCRLKASTSSYLGAPARQVLVAPAHRHLQRTRRQRRQRRQHLQVASRRCRRFAPPPSLVPPATARPLSPPLGALLAAAAAPPSPCSRLHYRRLRRLETLSSRRYGEVPVPTVWRRRSSLHLMTWHRKTRRRWSGNRWCAAPRRPASTRGAVGPSCGWCVTARLALRTKKAASVRRGWATWARRSSFVTRSMVRWCPCQ